jgi:hypothetical protein
MPDETTPRMHPSTWAPVPADWPTRKYVASIAPTGRTWLAGPMRSAGRRPVGNHATLQELVATSPADDAARAWHKLTRDSLFDFFLTPRSRATAFDRDPLEGTGHSTQRGA